MIIYNSSPYYIPVFALFCINVHPAIRIVHYIKIHVFFINYNPKQ